MTKRFLRKINRSHRKRGAIRTIDFLVSFSLFIILLAQFLIVLINTNTFLGQEARQIENPAKSLAFRILGTTGDAGWGTDPGVPNSFGLASNFSSNEMFHVDLSKLARLNIETLNTPYQFVDPSIISSQFPVQLGNVSFRISTRAMIQVESSWDLLSTTVTVQVNSWSGKPLSDINVLVQLYSLTNGTASPALQNTSITSTNGIASVPIGVYDPDDDYVALVFASSGFIWGIDWAEIRGTSPLPMIQAGGISTFVMPQSSTNQNNSVQIYSNASIPATPVNSSVLFYDPINGIVNVTTTSVSLNGTISMNQTGTTGPSVFFQQFEDVTGLHYRIVTSPSIYDNFNYTDGSPAQGFDKAQFPVYQTLNYENQNFANVYTYTALVTSIRGPFLMTFEVGLFS